MLTKKIVVDSENSSQAVYEMTEKDLVGIICVFESYRRKPINGWLQAQNAGIDLCVKVMQDQKKFADERYRQDNFVKWNVPVSKEVAEMNAVMQKISTRYVERVSGIVDMVSSLTNSRATANPSIERSNIMWISFQTNNGEENLELFISDLVDDDSVAFEIMKENLKRSVINKLEGAKCK